MIQLQQRETMMDRELNFYLKLQKHSQIHRPGGNKLVQQAFVPGYGFNKMLSGNEKICTELNFSWNFYHKHQAIPLDSQAWEKSYKPKSDWRAVDSSKKGINKFGFFAVKSKKAKTKQIPLLIFWENLRRANLLFVFI